jgi:hypothetical protein
MELINAPGRFDTPPRRLADDVKTWTGMTGVSAVFFTEVADPDRAAVLKADGWSTCHGSGRGEGECAIMTRDKARKVVSFTLVKLTEGGGKRRLAHPIYAPIVVTSAPSGRKTLYTTCHMPAHLERIWSLIPGRLRVKLLLKRPNLSPTVRTWLEAATTWRDKVTRDAGFLHVDDVVVAADWNLDAGKPWVHHLMHRLWPGLDLVATKQPDLGSRNVGWLMTNMVFKSGHVHKAGASDHDAGEFVLKHLNAPPVVKKTTAPSPFELCTYNGARMDQKTKTFVQVCEKDLGYSLTIMQGCYNPGGVAASGGTHDGGGVIDLAPFDFEHKVRTVRKLGGFGWHRLPIPGVWGEHIHFGIRNQGRLSAAAARQQVDYDADPPRDGLAQHSLDPTWHPDPPVAFSYLPNWHAIND